MSQVDDLIAFLRARLDEREAAANAAATENAVGWFTGTSEEPDERNVLYAGPDPVHPGSTRDYSIADRVLPAAAAHIALNDPGHALREVEADRRILADYADFCREVKEQRASRGEVGPDVWACYRKLRDVIRCRAAVWSDHPDYRQEWAVSAGCG